MSEKIVLTKEEQSLSDRLEQVIQFGGAISVITLSGVVRNNADFLRSLARIALHWKRVGQETERHSIALLDDVERKNAALREQVAEAEAERNALRKNSETASASLKALVSERDEIKAQREKMRKDRDSAWHWLTASFYAVKQIEDAYRKATSALAATGVGESLKNAPGTLDFPDSLSCFGK